MKRRRLADKDGNVTIPIEIRNALRLQEETLVQFELLSENTVLLRRMEVNEPVDSPAEMPSIKELLDSMTESQRSAAQCYLAILCSANGKNGEKNCL